MELIRKQPVAGGHAAAAGQHCVLFRLVLAGRSSVQVLSPANNETEWASRGKLDTGGRKPFKNQLYVSLHACF